MSDEHGPELRVTYGCFAAVAGLISAFILYPWLYGLHYSAVMDDSKRLVLKAYTLYAEGGDVKPYLDSESIAKLDDLNRRRGKILSIEVVGAYGDGFLVTRYVMLKVHRKWATEKETFGFGGDTWSFLGVDDSTVTSP